MSKDYQPTRPYHLEMVKMHPNALKHISRPSPEVQQEAVRSYFQAIDYVDEITEDLLMAAVSGHSGAMDYIDSNISKRGWFGAYSRVTDRVRNYHKLLWEI